MCVKRWDLNNSLLKSVNSVHFKNNVVCLNENEFNSIAHFFINSNVFKVFELSYHFVKSVSIYLFDYTAQLCLLSFMSIYFVPQDLFSIS